MRWRCEVPARDQARKPSKEVLRVAEGRLIFPREQRAMHTYHRNPACRTAGFLNVSQGTKMKGWGERHTRYVHQRPADACMKYAPTIQKVDLELCQQSGRGH